MDGFSKDDFKGHPDYVNDISKNSTYVYIPHVRKSTTHRDGNVLGKWSIILNLKLVSMSHSCPRMTDHCDVITPPIEQG